MLKEVSLLCWMSQSWEKPYLHRYTVEEMRMTITATPATTPMTMAIVWSESSMSGSSTEEQTRALSLKANHAVNRNVFSPPLPVCLVYTVFCVAFWSDVRSKSCMLYQALLSCFLVSLHWSSGPSFCLDDHRLSPTGLLTYIMKMKSKLSLLHNYTHF